MTGYQWQNTKGGHQQWIYIARNACLVVVHHVTQMCSISTKYPGKRRHSQSQSYPRSFFNLYMFLQLDLCLGSDMDSRIHRNRNKLNIQKCCQTYNPYSLDCFSRQHLLLLNELSENNILSRKTQRGEIRILSFNSCKEFM